MSPELAPQPASMPEAVQSPQLQEIPRDTTRYIRMNGSQPPVAGLEPHEAARLAQNMLAQQQSSSPRGRGR